jgi:hypothetical protein
MMMIVVAAAAAGLRGLEPALLRRNRPRRS